MIVGELLVQIIGLNGFVYEVIRKGLPNMVLGGRCEGRRLGRCGASAEGNSVSPEPDGEVLKDCRPSRGRFGCARRWGAERESEGG